MFQTALPHTPPDEPTVTDHPDRWTPSPLVELLFIFAKHWLLILLFVSIIAAGAAVVAFRLPNVYVATARFLPVQQSEPASPLASNDLRFRKPGDYTTLLRSDPVLNSLIDNHALMTVYGNVDRLSARRILLDRTDITVARDAVISIFVKDTDPQRAADLANDYGEELERYVTLLNVSEAAKQKPFYEQELKSANEAVDKAEAARTQAQQRSIVLLQTDIDAASSRVRNITTMVRSHKLAERDLEAAQRGLNTLEWSLDSLRSGQLRDFNTADAPEDVRSALLSYNQKDQDLKYKKMLLARLVKQYEDTNLDEAGNRTAIREINKALPPRRKSWPPRALFIFCSAIAALFAGAVVAYLLERFQRTSGSAIAVQRLKLGLLGRTEAALMKQSKSLPTSSQ